MTHMMGMNNEAEPVLHQLLKLDEQLLEDELFVQSERERLHKLPESMLRVYLQFAMSVKPVPAERVYPHILAYKGVATQLTESRLLRDQPELRELIGKLDAARSRLARLAYTAPRPGAQDDQSRQLARAREDKQYLESELARRSEAFRRQRKRWHLGPAEVARILPPGVVLVDLVEHEGGYVGDREPRLLACVIRQGRPTVCIDLPSGAINQAVRWWRGALVRRDADGLQAAASQIASQFWQPLSPYVADAGTLLVAPDGIMTQVPLAVLPGRRPGSYLIEDRAIGYVTSGRQVVEMFSDPAANDGRGLLAVGGVDYLADPGTRTTRLLAQADLPELSGQDRAGFTFLVGTEVESRHCDQLFRKVFPSEPVTLLTGAAAQEGRLKQESGRRYRYLHLATHGFFASPEWINALRLKVRPANTGPFAASGSPAAQGPGPIEWSDDLSLLESGIALAGAGRSPQASETGQEDGILTAEEVAALDLRGTELVTLSACDTGLGRITQGQGVLGLQQAFAAAGARTLVTSLWQVDDVATVILMEEFYKNLWQKRLPKLEALRQAQLTVLKQPGFVRQRRQELKAEFAKLGLKRDLELDASDTPAKPVTEVPRSHPSLWAAFVLSGDIR
jgi:CHAT domain-containing protein